MALVTEQPPHWASTVGTCEPIRVEMPLQTNQTNAIVQQVGDWDVDHAAILPSPYLARWLHMSQWFKSVGAVPGYAIARIRSQSA
jgi:hypothetical protein